MRPNLRAVLASLLVFVWMVGCGGTSSPYVESAPPVPAAPIITVQPQAQTVWSPAGATFTVTATGTGLQYEWKKNGNPVSGGSLNVYITPGTSVTDHGAQFTVTVSNAGGSVTSNPAILSVNERPTILQNPGDLSVLEGQPASFSVQGHGTPVLQYQWKRNGTTIPGATGTTYTIPATVRADNGALFTAVVTNAFDSATSTQARLTVGSATAVPIITQQPANLSMVVGQTGFLTVNATGTAPLRYQWRKNSVALAGQTTNTITFANAQDADAGTYDVIVQNDAGSATSQPATLTVTSTPPVIVTEPADAVAGTGQNATYSVGVTGSPVLLYQWRKNGIDIPGATAASYTTPAVSLADDFTLYSVFVKNAGGSALSATAKLRVFLARTLTGQAGIQYETASGEVSVAQDLRTTTIEAVQPNGVGGFFHFPAIGLADGTFTIPGVPPGPFYAQVHGTGGAPTLGLWTTNESLDLRITTPGRPGGVIATGDQSLVNLKLLGPLLGQVTIMDALIPNLALVQEQTGTGPFYRFPWKGLPLAESAKDDLWVVGLNAVTSSGTTVTKIAGALKVPAFAISSSNQTNKDVTLPVQAADQTVDWQVNADAYANLLAAVNPAVNPGSRGPLRVDLLAQPYGSEIGPLTPWPTILGYSTAHTGSLVDSGPLAYGDPFPTTWGRLVRLRQEFTFDLAVPGLAQPISVTDAIQELWPQLDWPAGVHTSTLGPVIQGKLNGHDMFLAQTGAGLTPQLSWSTRPQDHPTYYIVTIFKVNTADGTLQSVYEVSTEAASLAVVDGLLATGTQYVARIVEVWNNGYNPALPLRPSFSMVTVPVYSGVFQP